MMKIYQCQIIQQKVRELFYNILHIVNYSQKPFPQQEYINVFCRFRPPNELELSNSTNNSVILLSPKNLIITQEKNLEIKKDYIFDGLFEMDTSKEIFYERTSKPIIDKFLEGYNGSIICYGETGTGKTYTINEIIPQAITQIFDNINESDSQNELFKIDVSAIEIYKEQVNDLFDLENKNLNLITNKNNKLIIDNLTHIGVSSQTKLTEAINQGISKRNSNSPKYKDYNSKSHFIIILTLFHYYKDKNCMKISKLFLVDLEGSERLSKTKMEEEPLEEQKLINKSLIALSIIVQNLSNKNDNINYAPYRDSKLTRIISDSFGGNCFTSLILTCSKHEYSTVETRNTLMFGEKAKKIRNTPVINIEYNINKNNSYSDIFLGENIGKPNYKKNNNLPKKDIKNNIISNDNINKNKNMNMNNNNSKVLNDLNLNNSNLNASESNESNLSIKDIVETEIKFLKMQIMQLKEKIEQDNDEIEQLNERNSILENEKKNLMDEFENVINQKRKGEKEDILNGEYIKNNLNDLHDLLNQKELNEKKLKNEIYSLKLLLEKKNSELSEIINQKNREIKKIKDEQNDQFKSTFEELTDCLDQAANQLISKDQKIEELMGILNNIQNHDEANNKEIINLKKYINQLEKGKGKASGDGSLINILNNDDNFSDYIKINENNLDYNLNNNDIIDKDKSIKKLNDKIIELSNELKTRENSINLLNKEKIEYLKKKIDYENRINGMGKLINKMKAALENKNISLDNNDNKIINLQNELMHLNQNSNEANNSLNKLLNENNILRAKLKSLENNYNNLQFKNSELLKQINALQRENDEKFNKINSENISRINELQNELSDKSKDSLTLHNLKLKNQKLNSRIILLEEENKKLKELQNLNFELNKEIISKNNNIEEYAKLFDSKNDKGNYNPTANQDIGVSSINTNKNIIENLRIDITTKSKVIDGQKNNFLELEKDSDNINILRKNIDKSNNIINELLRRNEILMKENNGNKNIIINLRKEIEMKNNIIKDNKMKNENDMKENELNKDLIVKLKKELSSLNNIVIEYKSKNEIFEQKEKDNKNKINDLEKDLLSKEYIINDYKIKYEQIFGENTKNKNIINDLDNKYKILLNNYNILKNDYNILVKNNEENIKKNKELFKNIELMDEAHKQEINKYKEIIAQKEIEINSISQEYINSKQNLEKILELQRKISELKIENNKLYLKLQEYENKISQNEIAFRNKSSLAFSFRNVDANKDKVKSAYQNMIVENEHLKDNIGELKKYNH